MSVIAVFQVAEAVAKSDVIHSRFGSLYLASSGGDQRVSFPKVHYFGNLARSVLPRNLGGSNAARGGIGIYGMYNGLADS